MVLDYAICAQKYPKIVTQEKKNSTKFGKFKEIWGALGGLPKGPIPIFVKDKCLMTSYKSNNPSFKKKIMYFQMSKRWSIVATICGQYLARPLIEMFCF